MLEKGAKREAIHCKDQFGSHLFLLSKREGGQRPLINLKDLNTFIPYKDGRAPSIKGHFGTRRLYMQVGPQRRLFCVP